MSWSFSGSFCTFINTWVSVTFVSQFADLSPHDALKHHFTPLKTYLIFFTAKVFRRQISMKLFFVYIIIFFNLSPTSNHLHPLQVKNCDSNSRLVEDEDDNGKFGLERVKLHKSDELLDLKLGIGIVKHNLND